MNFKASIESRNKSIVFELSDSDNCVAYVSGQFAKGDDLIELVLGEELSYFLEIDRPSIDRKSQYAKYQILSDNQEDAGKIVRRKSDISVVLDKEEYEFDKTFVRRSIDNRVVAKVKPNKFNNPLVKTYEINSHDVVFAFIASLVIVAKFTSDVEFKRSFK